MSDILAREWLDDVTDWQVPDVRRSGPETRKSQRHPNIRSARELEQLQKRAWDESWQAGHQAGLDKGLAEGRAQIARQARVFRDLIDGLAGPLAAVEKDVEHELASLAMAIAREVIGREVHDHPDFILELVPRAVAALPSGSREVRVRLHPSDAALLHEHLPDGDGEASWSIVEDAQVSRGGCRVESFSASVDASLEARIQAVVERVFAEHDEPGPNAPETA